MAIYWNDIEILRLLHACESGERSGIFNGFDLIQAIATQRGIAINEQDYHSFVRELFVLANGGLLTWNLTQLPRQVRQLDPREPQYYLQNLLDPALTIAGRDRARGQIVQVPLPDPAEDDGRMIRSSTLRDVAQMIAASYTPTQALLFLAESGISMEYLSPTDGTLDTEALVSHVLHTLTDGTSGHRREVREFLGAWLDDALHSGPSSEQHQKLVRDLARQGWFVSNGRLVISPPVRRSDAETSPGLSPNAMHDVVWRAASKQWSAGHMHDAVLEAAKAVNTMLQTKLKRTDLSEVKLVRESLSRDAPSDGKPRLRFPMIEDDQTRESVRQGVMDFGAGCFQAIRNPVSHLSSEQNELSDQDALERLAALSLLARWIEQAEIQLAS